MRIHDHTQKKEFQQFKLIRGAKLGKIGQYETRFVKIWKVWKRFDKIWQDLIKPDKIWQRFGKIWQDLTVWLYSARFSKIWRTLMKNTKNKNDQWHLHVKVTCWKNFSLVLKSTEWVAFFSTVWRVPLLKRMVLHLCQPV